LGRSENRWDKAVLKDELGIPKHCRIIGTVGRLSREKGLSYLIKAAEKIIKEHPEAVFLVVGDGPLRESLEMETREGSAAGEAGKEASWRSFIFTGFRSDTPAMFAVMDVFVLPSLTEGLPMALLEAMASEKPIVATKVGAIPQVIENEVSGLLVEPGDAEAIAGAIERLLTNSREAKELGKNAYMRVSEGFSSQKMIREYVSLYTQLLFPDGAVNGALGNPDHRRRAVQLRKGADNG
jgi:glycosyltransferase involved in cell wall biosynthesis